MPCPKRGRRDSLGSRRRPRRIPRRGVIIRAIAFGAPARPWRMDPSHHCCAAADEGVRAGPLLAVINGKFLFNAGLSYAEQNCGKP
jgi:hypothetical protein